LLHHSVRTSFSGLRPELTIHYPTFEEARTAYPNCSRTALRAYARSEACRLANKLITPKFWDEPFTNVVALFADTVSVNDSALRQRRFDFVIMLLRSGRFERRIAKRLHRNGQISAETLAAVSA
jgi:hypothetical protein